MSEKLASAESAIQKSLRFSKELDQTLYFLYQLGGSIDFSPYKDVLNKLEGIKQGIRINENHQELIACERDKRKSHEII